MSALGRPCKVCNHSNLREIHRRVLSGDSIAIISAENALSQSSMYRHLRSHLSEEMREALTPAQATDVSDLVERLFAIADDLRLARERTQRNGSATAAVRAAATELRVLESLIDRLGIDGREVAASLQHGEALGHAVGTVVRTHPELVEPLADELRARGDPELAKALERAAQPKQLEREQL